MVAIFYTYFIFGSRLKVSWTSLSSGQANTINGWWDGITLRMDEYGVQVWYASMVVTPVPYKHWDRRCDIQKV